jgi:hypothetical protein
MGTRLPAPPDEPYELAAGVADRLRIQDFGITPAMEAAGGTVRYVLGHPTEAWKAELDLFSNGAAEIEARVLATKQFPVAAHVMELQTAGGAVLGSLSISDGDVAAIFKAANTVLSQAGVELVPPTVAAGNLVNPRPTTDSTFFDTTWTATNSSMDDLITTYQTPLIDVFFVRSIDAGTTSGGAQFPGMTDVLLNDEPGIVVTAYTNTTGAGPRRSNNEIARTLAHEFLHYAMKTKDHDPERKWNLFHEGNTGFPWKRDIDGTQAQKIIDAGLSPNSPDQ